MSVPPPVRRRSTRRGLSALLAFSVATVVAFSSSVMPAAADPGNFSYAEGRFQSRTAAGIDLDDIAALQSALAQNYGDPTAVTVNNPLSATVLNAVYVDLGGGVQLLGDNGVLTLGAVNQFAQASDDATSRAASGAVSNSGAINVDGAGGPPANATLDLDALLPAELDELVDNLSLTVGALSAIATQTNAGTPTGDYQIADLTLRVQFVLSRQNVIPFAQRNDPAAKRPPVQVAVTGWRGLVEEPGQDRDAFRRTFRAALEESGQ